MGDCGNKILFFMLLVFLLYFVMKIEMVYGNSVILNVMKVVEVEEDKYCFDCVLKWCVKCYDYVWFL